MSLVKRDPSAGTVLHRERVYDPRTVCAWCGEVHVAPSGRRWLWGYWTETDTGSPHVYDALYCSAGCRESSHGKV